jgi:hypothetical protein
MATFLISYRVPTDYVPGRPEGSGAWTSWFASMGASVTDIGKPIFESSALGDLGDGTKPGGYSMITADDLEAALTLAKGCPALREGGGVEVGLLADLPADSGAQA